MKYFFVADLHGINPNLLKTVLKEKGFKERCKKHVLCVAGDITHGGDRDNDLIKYLIKLEKHGQLLTVKGNHDEWTYCEDNKNYGKGANINESHIEWIRKLPFIVETNNFIMTHGIYITPEMVGMKRKHLHKECSHGSPCLIGIPENKWSGCSNGVVRKINETFRDINAYEEKLEKDLFVGHFHNPAAIQKLIVKSVMGDKTKLLKLIWDKENNIVSYGKIHFVASDTEANEVESWIQHNIKSKERIIKYKKSNHYQKMVARVSKIKVIVREW